LNLKISKSVWNGVELTNSAHGFTVKIPDADFFNRPQDSTLVVQFTPPQLTKAASSEGYVPPLFSPIFSLFFYLLVLTCSPCIIISTTNLLAAPPTKGKIGVIVEAHFDETEVHRFEEVFPTKGYEVEYVSFRLTKFKKKKL
jgi:hypothetical protein